MLRETATRLALLIGRGTTTSFAIIATSGMGVYPNDDGHKCISDLIWEADTIDPGVSPLKWKLGVPEAPNSNICT